MKNFKFMATCLSFVFLLFFSFSFQSCCSSSQSTDPEIKNGFVAGSGISSGHIPGQLIFFAGTSAPSGFLLCDGSLKDTSSYPDLFDAIGYLYGGSADSFALPDTRGRIINSVGAGYNLASIGGSDNVSLSEYNLPALSIPISTKVSGEVKIRVNEEDPDSYEAKQKYFGNALNVNSSLYNSEGISLDPADSLLYIRGVTHSLSGKDTISFGAGSPISIRDSYLTVNVFIKS